VVRAVLEDDLTQVLEQASLEQRIGGDRRPQGREPLLDGRRDRLLAPDESFRLGQGGRPERWTRRWLD
jgi:hypothetical protein